MDDSSPWIVRFLTAPATPLYVLVLMLTFWSYRVSVMGLPGIMERWNDRRRLRDAAKEADWQRLRDERDHAIESRNGWMERAVAAEAEKARLGAILQGMGEVSQAAAVAVAEIRGDPDKAPEAAKSVERVKRIRRERE